MLKKIIIFVLNIGLLCECYNTLPLFSTKKLKLLNNRFENINNTSEYLLELFAIIDVAIKVK